MYVRIYRFSGTHIFGPAGKWSYYRAFRMEEGERLNYWCLDFSKSVTDPSNEATMMRIYTSILAGKSVRFSISKTKFGGKSYPILSEEVICDLTKQGIRQLREEIIPSEIFIDTMWEIFISSHLVPIPFREDHHYMRLPYSRPGTFFDLLFLESFTGRYVNKYTMFKYVDFEMLNKILGPNGQNDPYWNNFYEEFGNNDYKMNKRLLILFVNAIVDFNDPNFVYIAEYNDGSIQYVHPDQYTIHPQFCKALKLYKEFI